MFTKYANVKLPENYSGSRFKHTTIDTEMKTHRPQDTSPSFTTVKTSVSPIFKSAQAQEDEAVQSKLAEADKEQDLVENENDLTEDTIETIYTPPEKTQKNDSNTAINTSSIKELSRVLEKIKSDDALLLALILLFAKDGGEGSLDALVILALLLLYH